jgi:hypothetical protein
LIRNKNLLIFKNIQTDADKNLLQSSGSKILFVNTDISGMTIDGSREIVQACFVAPCAEKHIIVLLCIQDSIDAGD